MQLIPSIQVPHGPRWSTRVVIAVRNSNFSLPLTRQTLPRTIAKVWVSETHLLGLLDTNLLDLESSDSYWLHDSIKSAGM